MTFSAEHIGLAANDPVALKNWYVRVFNATVLAPLSDSPPAYLLKLPGDCWIEIYAADSSAGPQGNRVAGWRHLALRVENIESARDDLVKLGVQFNESIKPAGGGGRVLFFADAESNLLHLVERPSGWPDNLRTTNRATP